MSDANFYHILGVDRSASADEIKSAYRELVKRYHPDLFPAAGEKAQATEKLRRINEAYAVLGDTERRRRYDQESESVQKSQTRPRAPAAAKRPRASGPRRQAERRKATKIPKVPLHFSKKWVGYALAAVTVILVLIYAGRTVPRLITAWTLLEKLEVSPRKNDSPSGAGQDWVPVGQYASVAECVGMLKERVRKDEQEGSRAVFGEPNGTMAITVFVKQETTAQARQNSNSIAKQERSTVNESALQSEQQITEVGPDESPNNGMTKRVRSLECRATRRLEAESWLRSTLRGMGLLS